MDRDAFVAVMNEASGMLEHGEATEALARLTAFDDALLDQPDPKDYGWIVSYRFRAAFAAGDFAQALHIADQGPARFAADIPAGSMATMYSMAVEAATQLGQADSAVSMADKCITIRRQLGAPNEVLMAAMTACTLLGDIERHDLATPYAVLLVREGEGFEDYRAYGYYALCAAVEHQVGGDVFDILWAGRDWLTGVDNEFAREAREYLDNAPAIRDRLAGALPPGEPLPPPEQERPARSGRRRAKDPTPEFDQGALGDLSPLGPEEPLFGTDLADSQETSPDSGPTSFDVEPPHSERSPFGPGTSLDESSPFAATWPPAELPTRNGEQARPPGASMDELAPFGIKPPPSPLPTRGGERGLDGLLGEASGFDVERGSEQLSPRGSERGPGQDGLLGEASPFDAERASEQLSRQGGDRGLGQDGLLGGASAFDVERGSEHLPRRGGERILGQGPLSQPSQFDASRTPGQLPTRGAVPPLGELPPFGQLQPLNHEVAFGEFPPSEGADPFGEPPATASEVAFGDFSAELSPPLADRFPAGADESAVGNYPLGADESPFAAPPEPDIPFGGLPQRSPGEAQPPRTTDPATMYLDLSTVNSDSQPVGFPLAQPPSGGPADSAPPQTQSAENLDYAPSADGYPTPAAKQPPADQVAGGETADALLAAGRASLAAAAFRALIDEAVEKGQPDSLIMAKSVLGLLTALIFDDRAAEAHAVWTDENAPTFLGIWALENGQTSVHDAIAYALVEAFLHALAGGDQATAAHSVDALMSRCVDYAFAQEPDAIAPMLNTWRQHIHEIFEGTPPPPALAALHHAEQRFGHPISPGPLYWMRPYPWVVDWL